MAGIIGEEEKAPDRRESLLRSLEIAVEIANTEKYGTYASGFAAYEVWIAGLLDDTWFEKFDKEKSDGMAVANAWCYTSLVDARARQRRDICGPSRGNLRETVRRTCQRRRISMRKSRKSYVPGGNMPHSTGTCRRANAGRRRCVTPRRMS